MYTEKKRDDDLQYNYYKENYCKMSDVVKGAPSGLSGCRGIDTRVSGYPNVIFDLFRGGWFVGKIQLVLVACIRRNAER